MCFTEFIGYTCGHQSLEVLRACPLTTQLHTNPVCSHYGRRPVLAPCMCPGCQRVLHGRAVLTTEWEHHWMHERGVCGCPVIFPDLIQPRIITPFRTGLQPTQPFCQTASGRELSNDASTFANGKTKGLGKGMVDLPQRPTAANSPGGPKKKKSPRKKSPKSQASSDAYSQQGVGDGRAAQNAGQSKPGGPPSANGSMPKEVHARVHSLYGAEWIDDHRQLHKAGSCNCAGDFSFYQTSQMYGFTDASWQACCDQEQAIRTQLGPQYQAQKPFYPAWTPGLPNMVGEEGHVRLSDQQQPGPKFELERPRRSTAGIWQVDLTMSTNPLYNYACSEGARMDGKPGSTCDLQGIDYVKPKDSALPLVGLPLGAGPEAPEYFGHVGSFEDCALNSHSRKKPVSGQETSNKTEEKTGPAEIADIVATLLLGTKDSPETRLFRLHHRKSNSL